MKNPYRSVQWVAHGDAHLRLLDQTKLPNELVYLECRSVQHVWDAIKRLSVRGAPAIGIAAAYAVALSSGFNQASFRSKADALQQVDDDINHLADSRPTAVNLFWALDRIRKFIVAIKSEDLTVIRQRVLSEADKIWEEDRLMCHSIGSHGAALLAENSGVLTHCNTGGLATAEYGTALSIILTAIDQGKSIRVFADETRPLLQGARLTAWELLQHDVPCTLICDSMAAQVMREGKVQAVVVGADRITACGDAANKIGTYGVAILAKYHNIPFYVAAPSSTFDLNMQTGDSIPIEQRDSREVTCGFGLQSAPQKVDVYNPAFDVTPASLIAAIVTERGVISPVNSANVRAVLRG